ncbi:MAG: radical SAM protein [Promethearchaeota archaeon]
MREVKIVQSKENTFYIKKRGIPKGCKYCLKGSKAVLFLNGTCQKPTHCYWYCPISMKRRDKKDTYINELKIQNKEEILHELTVMRARGMSITGGEPLTPSNLRKCLDFLKFVKDAKGREFHVHLYTNGLNFTKAIANDLVKAGLDEIRFHPPPSAWKNIKIAIHENLDVGAEMPVVPEKKYLKTLEDFIYYLDEEGAQFINLNEFEYCFPNSNELKKRGFVLEEGAIASVKNSRKSALELMNKVAPRVSLKMHFCTIASKDYWQLKERYKRRARGVKQPHEIITDEGLLMYAQIECSKNDVEKISAFLSKKIKIPKHEIKIASDGIQFPLKKIFNKKLLAFIESNEFPCHVFETLPFEIKKEEYITEKTPLKVFLEELKDHES